MSVKIGDRIPQSSFQVMGDNGPSVISTNKLFDGRTVVLVAVPGAFTPTCHNHHVPGYLENLDALKEKGVDEVAFTAVNDVHVMGHWAKATGAARKVTFLADGSANFAKAVGLDLDATAGGMGIRSHRYSMLVKDGVITQLNVEENPGVADVSSAATMLSQI